MRLYTHISLAVVAAAVVVFVSACDKKMLAPVRLPRLDLQIEFPNSGAAPRAKAAGEDTANSITRMELIVTTPKGKVLFRGPLTQGEKGWEVEAVLEPTPQAYVRVEAWHHDALMYSGMDTSVVIEPNSVATVRIVLQSYLPNARLTIQPNGSGPYAISADPRSSQDRMTPVEKLRVRYDWEDDGQWDTDYLSVVPYVHQYQGPGEYTVRAEVINAAGLTSRTSAQALLAPKPPPPQARFTVTPSEGPPGTFFLVDATESFAGRSATDSLRFRWDWNGDGVWDTQYLALPGAQVQLGEPGIYPVTLEVTDLAGRTATSQQNVLVRSSGREPVASMTLTPLVAWPNELVTADAGRSASPTEGGTLLYRWDWDGDGVWDTEWTPKSSAQHAYRTVGTHVVRLAVRDSVGATAVTEGQVVVRSDNRLAPGQGVILDGVSMRFVPAGMFTMGCQTVAADEFPAHQASASAFLIDTYEVTNAEYQRFVTATGHRAPPHWVNQQYWAGQGQLPVVNVTWDDAAAYAAWRGVRLPTEIEWEYAARGTDGRTFPWGNEFSRQNANYGENPVVPVGQFPAGASPFGVLDMAGNVAEWTQDYYRPYPGFDRYILVDPRTPERYDESRYLIADNPFTAPAETYRVVRGGSVGVDLGTNGIELRTTSRIPTKPGTRSSLVGFRCVRDME